MKILRKQKYTDDRGSVWRVYSIRIDKVHLHVGNQVRAFDEKCVFLEDVNRPKRTVERYTIDEFESAIKEGNFTLTP